MDKYAVNKDKKEQYQKLASSQEDKYDSEDIVNNIEIIPVTIINKECPICFDEIYSNEEYVIFDVCNHSYHLNCLNKWKCQCNSASTVYKCELCQEFRDIKEFNQLEVGPKKNKKPNKISWIKKCIRKLFG